jgi:hypothetical protein
VPLDVFEVLTLVVNPSTSPALNFNGSLSEKMRY